MKHADHLRLVDEEEQVRLAEKVETQRDHAAWEKAECRRLYFVGVIVVAAMIVSSRGYSCGRPIRF